MHGNKFFLWPAKDKQEMISLLRDAVERGNAASRFSIQRTFISALSQPVEETVLVDLRLISASILHRPGP